MKSLYLLTGICASLLLGACTVYEPTAYAPAPAPSVAYVTPSYVAPGYVVVH